MDDQRVGAGGLDAVGEGVERFGRLLVVDADAALDRDRNFHRRLHRRDAFGDQPRLAHQAGPEPSALHPVGRAAAVEVDLVIAEIGADPSGLGEPLRLRPAELQRDGMLRGVEADQPLARAEHHGVGGDHLGIEAGAAREQAMEGPAATVGPVHHRRDGKAGAIREWHGEGYRRGSRLCRGVGLGASRGGPMRFSVRHQTIYRYSAPVRLSGHVLRFNPRPDAGALVARALAIEPEPIRRAEAIDPFGNLVTRVEFDGLTDVFSIDSRFAVDVSPAPPRTAAPPPPLPWRSDALDPNAAYLAGDEADGAVRAFARKLAVESGGDALAFLDRLNATIYRDIRHDIRPDGAARPPEETLALGHGACRDVTMLFLAACRSLGIPARFVSGYQAHADTPDGRRHLHAWAAGVPVRPGLARLRSDAWARRVRRPRRPLRRPGSGRDHAGRGRLLRRGRVVEPDLRGRDRDRSGVRAESSTPGSAKTRRHFRCARQAWARCGGRVRRVGHGRMYYILATRNKEVADYGVVSLIIWRPVTEAHNRGLTLDLDGVISEPVLKFLMGFGSTVVPRLTVKRCPRRFEILMALRNLARRSDRPTFV